MWFASVFHSVSAGLYGSRSLAESRGWVRGVILFMELEGRWEGWRRGTGSEFAVGWDCWVVRLLCKAEGAVRGGPGSRVSGTGFGRGYSGGAATKVRKGQHGHTAQGIGKLPPHPDASGFPNTSNTSR